MSRKIYLASSWRNPRQPRYVQMLRLAGHEVYDFRHPAPGNEGFNWREVDVDWTAWSPQEFVRGLAHPIARRGFQLDMDGLTWSDTCVCLLPCGRSAHLELGIAAGSKTKESVVMIPDGVMFEPELMYLACTSIITSDDELLRTLDE